MIYKIAYLMIVLSICTIECQNVNNVCSTLEAYFINIDANPNCWYDAELNATLKERAEINCLQLEEHKVTTEDGYILTTFRLKRFDRFYGKEVVFLQHGLNTDATSFMINKKYSIGYYLANKGFDVWLGNFRGCDYCKHERLSEADPKYWDFSFHEHGLYDIPANMKYITDKTKKKVLYIGHSMGTTALIIYASVRPEEAKQYINHAILISPSVFLRHNEGLTAIDMVNNFYQSLTVFPMVNYYAAIRNGSFEKRLVERFCFWSIENAEFCMQLSESVGGISLYPIEWEKVPLALSAIKYLCFKSLLHYAQLIRTGSFLMFDYGPEENMVRYGRDFPPNYDLNAISIPLSLIYGTTDILTAKEDVLFLYNTYGKPNWDFYEIPHNHIDFLYLKVARRTILPLLLKILKRYTK